MSADAFRKAVEASDLEAAVACLSPDVVLHSPVTFKPFEGRDAVAVLFGILFKTFEDFRYVGEFHGNHGSAVLHFRARVGDREVEGIDMIKTGAGGLIEDFTVMVRPLSAATALRDAVGAQLAAS
ncbi:MAG: nuclear transport factor 2 family protein [Actinomycetota bacterium]